MCEYVSCDDCHLNICIKCYTPECYTNNKKDKKHQFCLECGQKIVCHFKKICAKCDLPLHYITDKVAVGSCGAEYNDFSLIFNLNYPENDASFGKIVYTQRHHGWGWNETKHSCYVIGMRDSNTPEDLETLRKVIHLIPNIDPRNNILFHCFSGYSRSVAVATAYIAFHYNKTVEEALEMISSKRKYVGPNKAFIDMIREEIETMRRIEKDKKE